jgi:tRNA (mo5U34)-methyltransferase
VSALVIGPKPSLERYSMAGGLLPRQLRTAGAGNASARHAVLRLTVAESSKPSQQDAQAFIDASDFVWHQQFELAAGVDTPGAHDIRRLFDLGGLSRDLSGTTVLDIGTSNGGAAFMAERLGAEHVVAVDVYPPDWFGFGALRDFLGSRVEYIHSTVYDLSRTLQGESFDLVLFWGVLYHLRHPLLALDELRTVLRADGEISIETAVSDDELARVADLPVVRFYRGDELAGDPSNWFSPTVVCLEEWCVSSGLTPRVVEVFGEGTSERCMLLAQRSKDPPEYARISYEVALRARPASEVE